MSDQTGQNGRVTSEQDRQRAVKVYQESDISVECIAEIFDVSRQTIYNWVNAAGVVGERGSGPAPSDIIELEQRFERLEANQAKMLKVLRELRTTNVRLLGIAEGFMAARGMNLPRLREPDDE